MGLLMLIGGALRVLNITTQSLWLDEAQFLQAAIMPTVRELMTFIVTQDYHPPAYPLMLRGWLSVFGAGDGAVRALPALFGVLLIPATAVLGHEVTRRRDVGLAAACIIAFNGYHLYLSQEGRHYSWLALIGVVHMCAFLGLWRSGGRRWLLLFGLSGIVGLLSHYHMVLVLGAEALLAVRSPRRRVLLATLGICLGVFLLVWMEPLTLQRSRRFLWGEGLIDPGMHPSAVVRVVLRNLGWTAIDFSTGSYLRLLGEKGLDPPDLIKLAVAISVALIAICGVMRLARATHTPAPLKTMAVLGLVPLAGAIAGGFLQAFTYETKYVSFTAPLWAIVLGAGCVTLARGWAGRAAVTIAAAGLGISAWHFHAEAMPWKEDWRGAASLIAESWQPGDIMLQRAHYTGFSLDHYLPFRPIRLASGTARFSDPAMADSVHDEFTSRDAARLWVVLSHDERALYTLRLLEELMPLEQGWAFQGIRVARFGRKDR